MNSRYNKESSMREAVGLTTVGVAGVNEYTNNGVVTALDLET